jgi:hypothetical protein
MEEKEALIKLLEELKITTEPYVNHPEMVEDYEKYLLIIALEKYIERYF